MVVLSRNPVNSTMFMILSFVATAGLFVLLEAYFIAVLQVLVYAGAVMVLFLFVIMLLNIEEAQKKERDKVGLFASVIGLLLLVFGVGYLIGGAPELAKVVPGVAMDMPTNIEPFAYTTSAKSFGYGLFTRYMLPFQMVGLLLLIAMVGVVVISKKHIDVSSKEKNKENV